MVRGAGMERLRTRDAAAAVAPALSSPSCLSDNSVGRNVLVCSDVLPADAPKTISPTQNQSTPAYHHAANVRAAGARQRHERRYAQRAHLGPAIDTVHASR
jgi:hypothetical protein